MSLLMDKIQNSYFTMVNSASFGEARVAYRSYFGFFAFIKGNMHSNSFVLKSLSPFKSSSSNDYDF